MLWLSKRWRTSREGQRRSPALLLHRGHASPRAGNGAEAGAEAEDEEEKEEEAEAEDEEEDEDEEEGEDEDEDEDEDEAGAVEEAAGDKSVASVASSPPRSIGTSAAMSASTSASDLRWRKSRWLLMWHLLKAGV